MNLIESTSLLLRFLLIRKITPAFVTQTLSLKLDEAAKMLYRTCRLLVLEYVFHTHSHFH